MAAGKQQIPLNVQPLPVGIFWVQVRAGESKVVQNWYWSDSGKGINRFV
ncbi:MAG: hypothetical protein IPO07_23700 [Haliscomenobacter sp.]|nr:hypothetical protein [Haliscomenobacter sp.]MBK9491453.1 hypothetical protein [Haliscomenobacter sp.]